MYFEEQTVFDLPNLPFEHPAYWLEDVIRAEVLPKKDDHDKEHEDILIAYGCLPTQTAKLGIRRNPKTGDYAADRLYHCMCHLRWWKDKGINTKHVERFEQQFNFNLNDLTMPSREEKVEGNY